MKKILQSLGVAALMTVAGQANAQLPDYGVYPGGLVLTDFGGATHDIDAMLDAGTPVLLDLFAVWCSPCWSYHQGGTLEDLYNSTGDGGPGNVKIFGVEADGSTPENTMDGGGNSIGDWVTGTVYPMANDDGVAGMMNLAYYPTLILICPDRTVTEVGQASESQFITAINNCGSLATNANDPRIVENTSASNITLCGGASTASTDIKVAVQNNSNVAINAMYTIEATIGATVVATTNTTLNLQPYAATEVNVGSAALSIGNNNVVVTITTTNDDLTNDDITVPILVEQAADLGIGDVTVSATFDGYGSEVGMGFASGTVANTDPVAAYNAFNGGSYPNDIDFNSIGTWTNSNAGFDLSYPSLATGCYHVYMFDNYGDGMTAGSNGALSVSSPNSGNTENYSVDYGTGGWNTFEITAAGIGSFAGITEAQTVEFAKVFPNPAVDMTNVQFNLTEASNVTVEMYNTMGQIIFSDKLGEVNGLQTVEIATSDLEAGIYLININVNGNVLTKRVSVAK